MKKMFVHLKDLFLFLFFFYETESRSALKVLNPVFHRRPMADFTHQPGGDEPVIYELADLAQPIV